MPSDSTALALLQRHSTLRVRQKKEWGEILVGFEGRNRYQLVAATRTEGVERCYYKPRTPERVSSSSAKDLR